MKNKSLKWWETVHAEASELARWIALYEAVNTIADKAEEKNIPFDKVELKPILEEEKIRNAVTIDIAALCMEFTKLDKICDHHIIDLDPIYISVPRFKAIYYPQGETFALDKKIACQVLKNQVKQSR
jgi:hypothetical protein